MKQKVYQFSAGPSVLSESVLKDVSHAAIDYQSSGLSIMEMSHRSVPIVELFNDTTARVKSLLNVPDHYSVLWVQGGASLQFTMIPMNLLNDGETADYADTGAWSYKAILEANHFGNVNVVCSSRNSTYNFIPKDFNQNNDSTYFHISSNNTIYGTQYKVIPKVNNADGYIVADMSSDIFSRKIDVSNFGLIYAGAQKNMGPAGVTMVIIRNDILGKINRSIPTYLDYQTHIEKQSLFNTPPVLAVYAVNRTLDWLQHLGGVEAIESINEKKAIILYNEIERNTLFKSPVNKEDRSMMNIPFVFTEDRDEADFLSFCENRGLMTLKGHRSVGGFRASIYNAMPIEGVESLVTAMKEYELING